jgi:hypothetical protein
MVDNTIKGKKIQFFCGGKTHGRVAECLKYSVHSENKKNIYIYKKNEYYFGICHLHGGSQIVEHLIKFDQ